MSALIQVEDILSSCCELWFDKRYDDEAQNALKIFGEDSLRIVTQLINIYETEEWPK